MHSRDSCVGGEEQKNSGRSELKFDGDFDGWNGPTLFSTDHRTAGINVNGMLMRGFFTQLLGKRMGRSIYCACVPEAQSGTLSAMHKQLPPPLISSILLKYLS